MDSSSNHPEIGDSSYYVLITHTGLKRGRYDHSRGLWRGQKDELMYDVLTWVNAPLGFNKREIPITQTITWIPVAHKQPEEGDLEDYLLMDTSESHLVGSYCNSRLEWVDFEGNPYNNIEYWTKDILPITHYNEQ